ncbi:MAG: PPC domain-containing protein [Acidobacteria bacterium]|nr:PPC domain-containing protein [Acidobacteriota bacterium]
MKALRIGLTAAMALALMAPTAGAQQQNSPHAGYVYPAGGQQGTSFRVRVGGRFLDRTGSVLVSGRGVRAAVAEYDRPIAGQQLTALRDKAQELQKKANDPAVRKELLDLRMKIGDSVRRNQNPTLSEIVTLEVTIAPDAEPGLRQLRLDTPVGLSNPLVFSVGQLPEVMEKELKNGKADAELAITVPAVVNGRIIPGDGNRLQQPVRQGQQYMPGDVDRYRFQARKGQDLVVAASARELMPYLADAVPGWFQATLALYDASGKEVAYDDDFRFQPDPVLRYTIPADGEYVVEIKDALYRGREDFVYRITIGAVPFLTGVFPLGGSVGAKTPTELTGWNLPTTKLIVDAKGATKGYYPVSLRAGAINSNRVPFALDTLPETLEREPNDTPVTAQRVTLPVIVNGRIRQPGDTDMFNFDGRAGAHIVAEVIARRLGSPLDSELELTDAAGTRIAFNDDHDDKSAGLITHQADSLLMATLPANGKYLLRISDTQHQGSPDHAYRLRISLARPDFDIWIAPSGIVAPAGGSVAITAFAVRKDGFAGDIALSLKDAPSDFVLSGGVVPAGIDKVRLTLTAPPAPMKAPISVEIEGRAIIDGKTVVHRAVPAEEMMQAFAYKHLIAADDLRVSVIARGATRVQSALLTAQPVKIPAGGNARIRVATPPGYRTFDKIELELSEPPDGISVKDVSLGSNGADFVIQTDASAVKAGLRGNLIVNVSGERVPPANAQRPATAARQRVTIGTLPAIPFEIIPQK